MCGRTCCTLDPGQVSKACSGIEPKGKQIGWKTKSDHSAYHPSTNIPPTRLTPVIVAKDKEQGKDDIKKEEEKEQDEKSKDFELISMLWGFVPVWYHGEDPTKHGYTTNNARIESLAESRLYKGALEKSQRCVVVCDGFYEWKSFKSGPKQPYLVYASQPKGQNVEDMSGCKENCWDEDKGLWTGPVPTYLAGIYTPWKGKDGEEVLSYSVITRDSNEVFGWLHSRIPAILPDAEAVQKWLDTGIEGKNAIKVLKPIKKDEISWHPVSRDVGNVRNQGENLSQPVKLDKTGREAAKESSVMAKWLKKDDGPDAKKPKN